jgi:hypothetical protein
MRQIIQTAFLITTLALASQAAVIYDLTLQAIFRERSTWPRVVFFREFYQEFTAGNSLSFQVTLDNIPPPPPAGPDSLGAFTLDCATQPAVETFANDPSGTPSIGAIAAPVIAEGSAVPEPGSWGL